MDFTIVDIGVAVIAVLSGILAFSRGFTRELFAIAGWIAAAIAAFYVAPLLEPLIREVPVVGSFLAESCVISMIAAFALVVAGALLVLSVFTPLVSGLVLDSALGPIDRMLGFLFGIARGLILIAIAFLIYTNLSGVEAWPPLDNAASRTIFEESAAALERSLPETIPDWFGERIDALMVNCTGEVPAATSPETGDVGSETNTTGAGTTGTGTGTTGTDTDTGTTGN